MPGSSHKGFRKVKRHLEKTSKDIRNFGKGESVGGIELETGGGGKDHPNLRAILSKRLNILCRRPLYKRGKATIRGRPGFYIRKHEATFPGWRVSERKPEMESSKASNKKTCTDGSGFIVREKITGGNSNVKGRGRGIKPWSWVRRKKG